MYDAIRNLGYGPSVVFFVSLIILGKFILLNLLIAILLGKFDTEGSLIDKELKRRTSDT
jgi:hypothetical protein